MDIVVPSKKVKKKEIAESSKLKLMSVSKSFPKLSEAS